LEGEVEVEKGEEECHKGVYDDLAPAKREGCLVSGGRVKPRAYL